MSDCPEVHIYLLRNTLYSFLKKLEERKAAFHRLKFTTEKDRDTWIDAMKLDLISSEESEMDDGEEVLTLHPIPWRSEKVDQMFSILDNEIMKSKSPQSQRQMKRRVEKRNSKRPVPLMIAENESLKWVIAS